MLRSRHTFLIAVVVMVAAWVAAAPMLSDRLLDAGWFGGDKRGVDAPISGKAASLRHPLAGTFEANGTSLADCGRLPERSTELQRCREQALGNLAFKDGPAAAFAVLEPLVADGDPSWRVDAHSVSHTIGSATLARGDEIGTAFGHGSMVGSAGYYHGIVLAMLDREDGDLAAAIRTTCATPAVTRVDFLRYQCHHGAGHGLMIHTGYDLPKSLEACEQLGGRQFEFDCTTGVFMENYAELLGVGAEGFRSPWLRPDKPLYPCTAMPARHREACYVQVVDAIGPAVRWNWKQVAATCQSIPHRQYIDSCIDSLGLWVNHWEKSEARGVNEACARTGSGRSQCLYGAARAAVNSDLTDPTVQRRAGAICDAAPSGTRARCYLGIGTVLEQAGPVEHRAGCARLAAEGRAACLRGFKGQGMRPPTLDTGATLRSVPT